MKNLANIALNNFKKAFINLKQDQEDEFFALLVKTYNLFCEDNGSECECIFIVHDNDEFVNDLNHSDSETFDQLVKARSMGEKYVWQMGDGLQSVSLGTLAECIEEEFTPLFNYALMYPKQYADFLQVCLSPLAIHDETAEEDEKAPTEICIDGKLYNKCYINSDQWSDCLTPCAFCHECVQAACSKREGTQFCKGERVCFIDLGDID